LDYLFSMVKKDEKLERLRVSFLSYIYAAVLLKFGEVEKSKFFVKDATNRSELSVIFAKTWLKRIACANDNNNSISSLIPSALEDMFKTL
jgi:hypothetical protein